MKEFIDYISEMNEEDLIEKIDITKSKYTFFEIESSKINKKLQENNDLFLQKLLYYSHCFNSNNILLPEIKTFLYDELNKPNNKLEKFKTKIINDLEQMFTNEGKITGFIKKLNQNYPTQINLVNSCSKFITFKFFKEYENLDISNYYQQFCENIKRKFEQILNKENAIDQIISINKYILIHPYCIEITNGKEIFNDPKKILYLEFYLEVINEIISKNKIWSKNLITNIFNELLQKDFIAKIIVENKNNNSQNIISPNIVFYIKNEKDEDVYLTKVKELKEEYMKNKWFISNQEHLKKESSGYFTTNLYNIIIEDHQNIKINFLGRESLILLKDEEIQRLIDFTKFFNNISKIDTDSNFYMRTQIRNNLNNIEDLYTINQLFNEVYNVTQFKYVKYQDVENKEHLLPREYLELLLFSKFPILKELLDLNPKELKTYNEEFSRKLNNALNNTMIATPFIDTYISYKNEFINFFNKKQAINIYKILYKFLKEYIIFEFLLILKDLKDQKTNERFLKKIYPSKDVEINRIYEKLLNKDKKHKECFRTKIDTMFTFLSIFDQVEKNNLIKKREGGYKNLMNTFKTFYKNLSNKKEDIKSDIEFYYEIGKIFADIIYKYSKSKEDIKEGYISEIIRQKNSQRIIGTLKKAYDKYSFNIERKDLYIRRRIHKISKYQMSKEKITLNNDCEMSLLIGVLDSSLYYYDKNTNTNNYKGGKNYANKR